MRGNHVLLAGVLLNFLAPPALLAQAFNLERESVVFAGVAGLGYCYYDVFSVQLSFNATTDLLKEDSIPDSLSKLEKTHTDVSFGALTINVFF
jgi:hypothetical protein